jgi:hypothetical protein
MINFVLLMGIRSYLSGMFRGPVPTGFLLACGTFLQSGVSTPAGERRDWAAVAGKDSLVIEATVIPEMGRICYSGPPLEEGVPVITPYVTGFRLRKWVALQVPKGFSVAKTLKNLIVDFNETQTLTGKMDHGPQLVDAKSELPPQLEIYVKGGTRVILVLNNRDELFTKRPADGKILGKGGSSIRCDAKNLQVF